MSRRLLEMTSGVPRSATLPDGRWVLLVYRPDPPEHRKVRFGRCLFTAAAAAVQPPDRDLRSCAPAVMDQYVTGSCEGHASAGFVYTAFAAAGQPLPFVPSPAEIYRNARGIDRVVRPDGSFDKLVDEGAEPNQCTRAIETIGVRPTRAPMPDGRNSDADPATINDEPKLGDVEQERLVVPVGFRLIDDAWATSTAAVELAVRQAIAAGFPVRIGLWVDTAFMNWTPQRPPLGATDSNDVNGGGHALYVPASRTTSTGKRTFIVRNSWGESWGDAGDIEVTSDFLACCTDLTVCVPELEKGAF